MLYILSPRRSCGTVDYSFPPASRGEWFESKLGTRHLAICASVTGPLR